MTTSTAPITLPAKHRQEAPLWRIHLAIAYLVWLAAITVWAIRGLVEEFGRRYLIAALLGLGTVGYAFWALSLT